MPVSADRTGPAPNVHLSLLNLPENVMLVRQALTGIGEAIDLDARDLYEATVAVTEACNNVVLHAYGGDEGPLEVDVYVRSASMEVVVRDRGVGIQPSISAVDESTGTGLPVMQALSHLLALNPGPDGGTEVWMTFDTPGSGALDPPAAGALEPATVEELSENAAIEITLAPTLLSRTILPRLLSVCAARAHFTTDRLLDGQLIADELAACVEQSPGGGQLIVSIGVKPREVELRIAPLPIGQANRFLMDAAVEYLGPVIGRLSTQHRVTTLASGNHEMLALRLAQPA